MVVGGWEEIKLTTSLCKVLEESEVCQFGGFPPSKKTLGFFYLQIYVNLFDEYS
jgi:hypothetical protein